MASPIEPTPVITWPTPERCPRCSGDVSDGSVPVVVGERRFWVCLQCEVDLLRQLTHAAELARLCRKTDANKNFVEEFYDSATPEQLRELDELAELDRKHGNRPSPERCLAPGEERPQYRFPEELTPEQAAELADAREVDAEAFLRWLETGEGPDPRRRGAMRKSVSKR